MENKNEVKIVSAIVCQSSLLDQQTNNISLLNVLEDVRFDIKIADAKADISKGISLPFQFDFVVMFARSDTLKVEKELSFNGKVSLVSPEGIVLIDNPIQGVIEKGKKRFRMTIKFNGVKLTKSGVYVFRCSIFGTQKDNIQTSETPVDFVVNLS